VKRLALMFLVAYGQVGLAQDRGAAQAFVGCYELRIEGTPRLDYGNQFLPKRFELKTQRSNGGFATKNLDSRVRWDLSLSAWHLNDDGSLTLNWSTGYVGWVIQLNRSRTDDLSGTARFWTDTGSEHRTSHVVVRTGKCGDSRDKS
jgi:hypothetical protein